MTYRVRQLPRASVVDVMQHNRHRRVPLPKAWVPRNIVLARVPPLGAIERRAERDPRLGVALWRELVAVAVALRKHVLGPGGVGHGGACGLGVHRCGLPAGVCGYVLGEGRGAAVGVDADPGCGCFSSSRSSCVRTAREIVIGECGDPGS